MRRRLGAALALCALLAGGAADAAGPRGRSAEAAGPPARSAETAVGVAQREFRLSLYRSRVPAGRVRLNVRNFGEDAHNLVVRGPGLRFRGPELRSGERTSLVVRMRRPGRYRLLCTKAGHHRLGMTATLRVVRR